MCCSNAERIQILYLPISDIGRYLTLVPRLRVLACVAFQIDKNLIGPSYWNHGMGEVEKECWTRLKEGRVRHLEMISFVQEHQRHHRNVIQTARCANVRVYEDQCPEDYTIRLLQSLPPLVKPQFLDCRNWDQFVAHLPDRDLSFVREIRTRKAFDRNIKLVTFLRRRRSLESIHATSSVEGIFKWAVQERKDFNDAAAVHNCGAAVAASEQRSLVPLRDYDVMCSGAHAGRQASDVIYAFNKTLENIKVKFCGITTTYGSQRFPDFVLGRKIDDDDDDDGHRRSGAPRNLVRLELHLYAFQNGAPAAPVATGGQGEADDNSSMLNGIPDSFTKPTQQGPVAWTWDWDIPKLINLFLVAEFALKFQFRMLDSTPNLNYLSLNVNGGAGPERNRTIGIKELLRPGFRHSLLPLFLERDQQLCERRRRRQVASDRVEDDDDDDAIFQLQRQEEKEDDELWRQEFQFLQLPKLQTLSLIGHWDVDHPRVLNAFFSKVAPRITSLWVEPVSDGRCYCQEGFMIPELIRSTTENLHELNVCVVKIPFKLELMVETGLVDDTSYDRELPGAGWWRVFVMVERPAGRRLNSPARYRFRNEAGTVL
ncbi:hypothetical protein KI688_010416 [Linnemannia hyalina]|uniref:Uncharacterized protein n=1 Tax=Linnemannia hyalina TaxID=64524 RepID=A0A9P7XZH5_9FUNG|nr:hypothetical protein KI688_010416 [Linnemannia hyalina]